MRKELRNTNSNITDTFIRIFPFTRKIFETFPGLVQFFNFGIVGLSNTIIAYSVYAVLVYFNLHPQIANLFAFAASVTNAYIWNRFWVFKGNAQKKASTPFKFFAVYGGNLLLGIFLLYLFIDVWHINKYLAPLLSLPLTVPVNYLLNKFWVFKKAKP